jgi:tetratricopeptide (TPR) repeat protein
MRGMGVLKTAAALLLIGLGLAAPAESDALQRGQAAFRRGDWAEAEKSFLTAVREKPSSAAALKWLGMVYTAQNKFDLAETPFRRACEIDPREELACYYLGRADYALSRYEESRSAFETALRDQPASSRIKRARSGTVFEGSRGWQRQGGAFRLWSIPVPPGAPQRESGGSAAIGRSGEPGTGGSRTRRGSWS